MLAMVVHATVAHPAAPVWSSDALTQIHSVSLDPTRDQVRVYDRQVQIFDPFVVVDGEQIDRGLDIQALLPRHSPPRRDKLAFLIVLFMVTRRWARCASAKIYNGRMHRLLWL